MLRKVVDFTVNSHTLALLVLQKKGESNTYDKEKA